MDPDDFPRGPGDPDTYGYDGDHDPGCKRLKTGHGPDCDCSFSEPDDEQER